MIKLRNQSLRSKRIMRWTAAVVLPNFLAFLIGSLYLGGDALNGYVQAGHYFLCAHGNCRDVAESVWNYSYWHAVSAMGGLFLVFIEAAIFVNTGEWS